jgi:hypothetical protein
MPSGEEMPREFPMSFADADDDVLTLFLMNTHAGSVSPVRFSR